MLFLEWQSAVAEWQSGRSGNLAGQHSCVYNAYILSWHLGLLSLLNLPILPREIHSPFASCSPVFATLSAQLFALLSNEM